MLEPLREVRALDERVKRGELAVAVDGSRASEAGVARTSNRVAGARDRLADALRARHALAAEPAGRLAIADTYIGRCRRDLDAALGELARASAAHAGQLAEVDIARARLTLARADRELIDRHFARRRDERKRLAERRED